MNILKKIRCILDKKQMNNLYVLLFLIFISSGLELLGVSAIQPLASAVTDPDSITENAKYRYIINLFNLDDSKEFVLFMALSLAALYIIKNVFLIWMKHKELQYIQINQQNICIKMFNCYIHQDYIFHVNTNVSKLQRNVNTDVSSFFILIQNLIDLITEVVVCLVLTVYLAITDIWMTVLVGGMLGALLGSIIIILKKRLLKLGKLSREYSVIRGKWFLQSFNGIKEIKAGSREGYFKAKYRDASESYVNVAIRQTLLNYIPKPLAEMLCISGVLVFLAVRILLGGDMTKFVPTLSVFAIAAFRMLPSFNRISGDLGQIMFNKPSLDALYEDLTELDSLDRPVDNSGDKADERMDIKKDLVIKDISFSYPSKPDVRILDHLSLNIQSKRSVALIGPSGSGKTTLADIILGIYKPDEGSVYADGADIFTDMDKWHNTIGYIPQTIYLIDDTIRANIAFGIPEDRIDDAKIWQALESAQLADFVRQQPDGLDSNIGDRGVKLSGGQRQRIGIARALYTDPDLLILDEATSALDNDTESAVMDAIYGLAGKLTMIVIAHRLTTIKNCDDIYRISGGKAEKISYEKAIEGIE